VRLPPPPPPPFESAIGNVAIELRANILRSVSLAGSKSFCQDRDCMMSLIRSELLAIESRRDLLSERFFLSNVRAYVFITCCRTGTIPVVDRL